jgi:hypothetical protein
MKNDTAGGFTASSTPSRNDLALPGFRATTAGELFANHRRLLSTLRFAAPQTYPWEISGLRCVPATNDPARDTWCEPASRRDQDDPQTVSTVYPKTRW